MIDPEVGALFCNQCFSHDNGDGIAAVMWLCGWDFTRAVAELDKHLGLTPATAAHSNGKSKIVATYNYVDEQGELLFQVVRFDPKDFRQRRPKAGGGWEWRAKGTRVIPYQLPKLLAADPAQIVFVCEGEKDVDNCHAHNLVATCNAGGAGKWRSEHAEFLRGRKVCIIADKDKNNAGRKHAKQVAASLQGIATSVKVVEVPTGKDASDYFAAGGTVEELLKLVEGGQEWKPSAAKPAASSGDDTAGAKPTQSTLLVNLALAAGADLWHTADQDAYASLPVCEHVENCAVRGRYFRRWLSRLFYKLAEKTPGAQALQDATNVMEGIALYDRPQHESAVRVAEHEGGIYLDLADEQWRAVKITVDGWEVVEKPAVRFRRPKAMLALPAPIQGGNVDLLRRYINVTDGDWPLVVAWLLACYRPVGPYPVLSLHGEQGSAKSTSARALRSLIDPNSATLRCEPKEPRDLAIAANNGWVMALDNLSYLPTWLSDAICRLSTGGGFATRTLYENDEETIFSAQRPVIITGIEEVATRGDLLDRSILVTLPTISEKDRLPESVFWREYEEAQAMILGALLTAVAASMRRLPHVHLARSPRMADFALWASAGEEALGLAAGTFMAAYSGNRAAGNELALEASPVAKVVIEMMLTTSIWSGTATELVEQLENRTNERTHKLKAWPKTARGLSGALKRIAPNLRAAGVEVEFCRERDHQRRRIITISRLEQTGSFASTPSTPSETRENVDANTDGSDANGPASDAKCPPETLDRTIADGSDARIPLRSKVDPAVCLHEDVEETPTFDGYLNRQCRQCGKNLGCRKAGVTA